LNAKSPKLVSATISVLRDIFHTFGCKVANPRPVLKLLPPLFGHSDKIVRSEATALIVELYGWLGDAIRPALTSLNPVLLKQIDESFSRITPGEAQPTRQLKSAKESETEAAEQSQDGINSCSAFFMLI